MIDQQSARAELSGSASLIANRALGLNQPIRRGNSRHVVPFVDQWAEAGESGNRPATSTESIRTGEAFLSRVVARFAKLLKMRFGKSEVGFRVFVPSVGRVGLRGRAG